MFAMAATVHAAKPPTNNAGNASSQAQSHAATNSAVVKNMSSSPYPVVSEPIAAPLEPIVLPITESTIMTDPFIVDSAVTQTLIDPPEVNPLSEITRTNPQLNLPQVGDVPLPAAVWLFSSAIAGLIGFGKRKAVKD